MLRIKIVHIGKPKHSFLEQGVGEYIKRLQGVARVDLLELDNSKFAALPPEHQQQREGDLLRTNLSAGEYLILLDRLGRDLTSQDIATTIQKLMNSGRSALTFAIGGPHGWDAPTRKGADMVLALSKLTFTSQMARLLLTEQLYRAFSIIGGSPYHK